MLSVGPPPVLPLMAMPSVPPYAAPDPAWVTGKENQRIAQLLAATVLGHMRANTRPVGRQAIAVDPGILNGRRKEVGKAGTAPQRPQSCLDRPLPWDVLHSI